MGAVVADNSGKKMDVLVTVVAPVLGEAEVVAGFVKDVSALVRENFTNYEIILVDSGAEVPVLEAVVELTKELPCIRVIRLSRTANRDVMLFAGLEAAIGDYVVVAMPATDPPHVILDLVRNMAAGFDIVYGLSEKPLRRSWVTTVGARLFYWYGRKYLGLNIPPNSTYLVGLNRRSTNALTRIKGRYRHVRHLTRQVGFKTAVYHYKPLDPGAGAMPARGFMESLRLAKEIVVSYSQHPLRVVSMVGLVASLLNLGYAVYVIAVYVFNRRVSEGWTTLSLELAVMFFILFIILSVICEYIGRILEETRAQPAYHIMEEISSTVLVADETRRNVLK
jgi:polyisoprenyl-phosphate glycosyltransferase